MNNNIDISPDAYPKMYDFVGNSVNATSGVGENKFLIPVLTSILKKYCIPLIKTRNINNPHITISRKVIPGVFNCASGICASCDKEIPK